MALQEITTEARWVKWYDADNPPEMVDPTKIDTSRFLYCKMGDKIEGWITDYNPMEGATNFQKKEPCGMVSIKSEEDGSLIKIALDKDALVTKFDGLELKLSELEENIEGTFVVLGHQPLQESNSNPGRKFKTFSLNHDPDKRKNFNSRNRRVVPVSEENEADYEELL